MEFLRALVLLMRCERYEIWVYDEGAFHHHHHHHHHHHPSQVDRGLFVRHASYQDTPQPIGHGATISAPHMHAYCLDLLEPILVPGAHVLDVGSGSGYLTAVMAELVGNHLPGGIVRGEDHVPELIARAKEACVELNSLTAAPVEYACFDSRRHDRRAYDNREYDVIHVGAAIDRLPEDHPLLAVLKPGGRLVAPVGPEGGPQRLLVVEKDLGGRLTQHAEMGCIYIPLTSFEHQTSC
jgi:protein-L-isoaspartate(D-aspartate) O-methyltransferase